ncbi:MAG: T9SS type A sorting domain-containing protein [Chitinophagaceae bacterium]|nr:T9SS type A sorting domain-containing protein [Chitinophagaceae bacterium]
MLLFPIPANSKLSVEFSNLIESLSIFSINGTHLQVFNHLHKSKFELDVSELSSGMYFITASSKNKIYRGKFLVER